MELFKNPKLFFKKYGPVVFKTYMQRLVLCSTIDVNLSPISKINWCQQTVIFVLNSSTEAFGQLNYHQALGTIKTNLVIFINDW